jgi:rRNA small subunit pseudouridine methyltransferase Nep1
MNVLIIEEASLEILPSKFEASKETKLVTERFGIRPVMQILDKNFHRNIVSSLRDSEKRGRPDVVHFAMLDVTSTPLFEDGLIRLFIRTRQDYEIEVKPGTRLPRTLQRFCGVMAKLISGRFGAEETKLFDVAKNKSFASLVSDLKLNRVVTLSPEGSLTSLRKVVSEEARSVERTGWIVGGFPHGSFSEDVIELSDRLVSISPRALPAHVVTARLCYELEENSKESD